VSSDQVLQAVCWACRRYMLLFAMSHAVSVTALWVGVHPSHGRRLGDCHHLLFSLVGGKELR
jgi:hypothetical protein